MEITTVKYTVKPGSMIAACDAQVIGEEIQSLAGTGGVTPAQVVDASRDEGARLHRFFTWDDAVAADNWRLREARQLLNSVEIVVSDSEGQEEPETVRAFHVVRLGEQYPRQKYYPLEVVASREDWAAQVVQRAKAELRAFKSKYSRYQKYIRKDEALSRAFDAIHGLDED